MRQALHIFRKDVGLLRYYIAFTLIAAVALCFMTIASRSGPGPTVAILPAAWWFLIAAVIHAEPLTGTGHFWLTKPYSRGSLLVAKVLFIAVFVNVPVVILDLIIVHFSGLSISANASGLLWTQVLLVAAFEIPATAIAAITSDLLEFLIATLVLVLVGLAWFLVSPVTYFGFSWRELEWIRSYYFFIQVAIAGAAIVLCQYVYRATMATRIAAIIGPILLFASVELFPWTAAFGLQMHCSRKALDTSSIAVKINSERKWAGRIYRSGNEDLVADVPVEIDGLPRGTELKPYGVKMGLVAPDGQTLSVKAPPPSSFEYGSGAVSLRIVLPTYWYEKHRREALQLHGTLYFALYEKPRYSPIPVSGHRMPVDGIGVCTASTRSFFCGSAFRRPANSAQVELTELSRKGLVHVTEQLAAWNSPCPFPAEFNVDPVFRWHSPTLAPIVDVLIRSSEPIAYSRRSFAINHLVLGDFTLQE